MKKTLRQLLLALALLGYGPFAVAVLAEDTPVSTPTAGPTETHATPTTIEPAPAAAQPPTVEPPPAVAASSEKPDQAVPPIAPSTTAEAAAPAASLDAKPKADGELRRIDTPAADASRADAPKAPAREKRSASAGRKTVTPRVSIFGDSLVRKDEFADSSVAVFGNSTNEGGIGDAVVAVFGNARSTGPVGDSVVAVLGNVYVDNDVTDVVAVLGNVELGPKAYVRGDVVTVGGTLKRDPNSVVKGDIPTVGFGPVASSAFDGLHAYLQQCVYKLRPLGFGANLGWVWAIAFGFLFLYVVIALLFRRGVERCVETFETRPGSSILAALIMVLLTPILAVLLAITVVGLPCLFVAALFAKAVMLAWMGRQVAKLFGEGPWSHPAFAVLIGGFIAMALYLIPVVGFIVYKLLGVIGLGVIVYTLLLASKKEKRTSPPAGPASGMPASVPMPAPTSQPAASGAMPAAMAESAAFAGAMPDAGPVAAAAVPAPASAGFTGSSATIPPMMPPAPASVLVEAPPRAGFWIRMGALAIDIILIAIVLSFTPRFLHLHFMNGVLPLAAAYGAVLWKLKGTTIGGIICGLRVVRIDNREMDWATAIVRALACFVSLFVGGLGFIWVVIDDEKQSWHDKIAGTTVVHSRGNMSLI